MVTAPVQPYRLFTSTDPAELAARIEAAHRRFAALLGEVDAALPLPRSTWTARDVAGHMLTVVRRYTRRDRRSSEGLGASPREVDRLNAAELAALGDATREQILADLDAEMSELVRAFAAATDLHRRFPFHGSIDVDAAAGMGNLLAEFCIHGRDVAAAAHRAWRIEERDAVLVLYAVMQIIPAYAVRSARTSLRVRLDVPGAERWLLDFDAGTLQSRAASPRERCDVVLRCPAETLVLTLYSRLKPQQAVLHGMRIRGGRRPWRVARLPKLLQKP